MAVGTSLGAFYEDDLQHNLGVDQPPITDSVVKPKEDSTRDKNVLTPKGLEGNKVLQKDEEDLEGTPIANRIDVYQGEPPNKDLPDITNKSGLSQLGDDVFGTGRYDVRPALGRMLEQGKNALTLPGDVLSGKVQPGSIQEIERATDLAGLMVGGPAPIAAKMADGTLGSFAGVGAKTARTDYLDIAKKMYADEGHTAEDIWKSTGWFKDIRDGKWKWEINDQGAKLKEGFDINKSQVVQMDEMLDHPELYKAYPGLKNIPVHVDHGFQDIGM